MSGTYQIKQWKTVDKKSLPHQRLKSTISVVAPTLCPRSNNGKRPRILLVLREPSKKTSNGIESRKNPNSQINPVLPKSKKNLCSLENVSYEARIFKHKIVLDERYERKVKDYNVVMDHGFRRYIRGAGKSKYMKKKVLKVKWRWMFSQPSPTKLICLRYFSFKDFQMEVSNYTALFMNA